MSEGVIQNQKEILISWKTGWISDIRSKKWAIGVKQKSG